MIDKPSSSNCVKSLKFKTLLRHKIRSLTLKFGNPEDKNNSPSNGYTDSKLTRSGSLRSTSTSNWKDLFPSLTRTPSNLQQSDIGKNSN